MIIKNIFIRRREVFLAIIGLVFLAVPCWAVDGQIFFDQSVGSYQIKGSDNSDALTIANWANEFASGRVLVFSSKPNPETPSTSALTPSNFVDDLGELTATFAGDGIPLWVRVWEGAAGNSNYGYQNNGYMNVQGNYESSTSSMKCSEGTLAALNKYAIASFYTNYRTDNPPAPNVVPGTPAYAEQTNAEGKKILVPYLRINFNNSDTTHYELQSFRFRIFKDDPLNPVIEGTIGGNASASYTTNPATEPLEFSTTYYVDAMVYGYFGKSSGWSGAFPFETVTIGEGMGPVDVDITLRSSPETYGVNTFSIPFPSGYYFDQTVSNLKELITAINNASGQDNVVRTLGYWDSSAQRAVGWTFTEGGVIDSSINTVEDPVGVNIVANRSYQIYIEGVQEVSLTLSTEQRQRTTAP